MAYVIEHDGYKKGNHLSSEPSSAMGQPLNEGKSATTVACLCLVISSPLVAAQEQ